MRTIQLSLPSGTIELLPVDRTQWGLLRSTLAELQSRWIEAAFATGAVASDPDAWALMKAAISAHSRADAPGTSVDLDAIGNDYEQLERLFFSNTEPELLHQWDVSTFDLSKFVGGSLVVANGFNPKSLLNEAEQIRLRKKDA